MYVGRRILSSLLVGGWVLSTLLSNAHAQISLESTSGKSQSRPRWEQQSIGQGAVLRHSPRSDMQQGRWRSVTEDQFDPWANSQVVSTTVEKPGNAGPGENIPIPDAAYDVQLDPMPMGDVSAGGNCATCGGGGDCGPAGCSPGGYAACGYPGPYMRCPPYLFDGRWLRNFSFFAGVQGFKGPVDAGANGNFGFHEGLNYGNMLGGPWPIGFQAGFQVVHSDFYGTNQASTFGPGDNRNQFFFTGGLFRRALEGGLQWGVAVDAMRDQYYGQADLAQLRTEVSFVRPGRNEVGYWGAYGTKSDNVLTPQVTWRFEPISQHVFFIRRYFAEGGEGRLWAGFTGGRDGLIGGDLRLPLGRSWAIENRFNYLIPQERRGAAGMQKEAWAVRIQLVWYPRRSAHCVQNNPFRPLFDVADNAVFMVDRQ